MPHPLVTQLRFARSEFQRTLEGLSDADARRRFQSTNCISWNVGHLASTEQTVWLSWMQGQTSLPELDDQFGYGQPASTPPLAEVWEAWQRVTEMTDPFLDSLTTQRLQEVGTADEDYPQQVGALLLRVIYHYWYHIGEIMTIRQLLGHTNLPEFVGDLDTLAPYLPH